MTWLRGTVLFQPVVDLVTGKTAGHEALFRPAGSKPSAFFRAAARAGRGVEVDRAACRAAARGYRGTGLLFLNLTAASFLAGPGVLRGSACCPGRTVVEVTEHGELGPREAARAAAAWHREGFRIAADDVEPGTPRFEALAASEPEFVKVGRAAGGGETFRVISRAARRAARWGGVVVAEGIESEADLERARRAGAGLGQGFLLGRPLPEAVPGAWGKGSERR